MMSTYDDAEIPCIEIKTGWLAEEVASIEEAEDAFAYLMSAVAEIEYRIDLYTEEGRTQDVSRAKRALKYKRAALQIVNHRAAALKELRKRDDEKQFDSALLAIIRAEVTSGQMSQWAERAQAMLRIEATRGSS